MDRKKNQEKSISWEDFKAMGNPENAEDLPEEENEKQGLDRPAKDQRIRISLDRKKRKGKGMTVIDGLEADDDYAEELTRKLKKMCGVGGSYKDSLILIQGDQRSRLKEYFIEMGFRDTKISGG